MNNLDELKKTWSGIKSPVAAGSGINKESLRKILVHKANKQKHVSMKYFWASFVLQIIVYAMAAHVMVKYWHDTHILIAGAVIILFYIPFTVMLLNKYKQMAILKVDDHAGVSMLEYVKGQHTLLKAFYHFKRKYEWVLIPVSTLLFTWIFFKIYIPGGVGAHPWGAVICLGSTLLSCVWAIRSENRRNFRQPLKKYENILEDLREDI